MKTKIIRWSFIFGFVLALSSIGFAQEAITGRVTDASGSVVAGATIKAVQTDTGETTQITTGAEGAYRVPVRPGHYTLTATVEGFAPQQQQVEVLVDQAPNVDFNLTVAAVAQSVDVVEQAPLLDASTSRAAGNIDPVQVDTLPMNGRNWLDLITLAPGATNNGAVNDSFMARDRGDSQINMDGEEITNVQQTGFGEPHYSKDSIAEFEYVSNRFDASQGRSSRAQVNAVTKSGTNQFIGMASGYFRNSIFNSQDFFAINQATDRRETLPYSDQQLSFTGGGPIIKDKLHYFGNYEYERQPITFAWNTPFGGQTGAPYLATCPAPCWNYNVPTVQRTNTEGGRVDGQFGSSHLTFRMNAFDYHEPIRQQFYNGATFEPESISDNHRYSFSWYATWTMVLSNESVNKVSVGYNNFHWLELNHNVWTDSHYPAGSLFAGTGGPQLNFVPPTGCTTCVSGSTFSIGEEHPTGPENQNQHQPSIRDDYTHSFSWHGAHTIKTGGEYIYTASPNQFLWGGPGSVTLNVPAAVYNNLPTYFGPGPGTFASGVLPATGPNIVDVDTWNLAAVSPYAVSTNQDYGNPKYESNRQTAAIWFQDDWQIRPGTTLNLGVRYDLVDNEFGENYATPGLFPAGRPFPKTEFAPRLGFAQKIGEKTVLRGGFGKYFAEVIFQSGNAPRSYAADQQAPVSYFGTATTAVVGSGSAATGLGLAGGLTDGSAANGGKGNPISLVTLFQAPPPTEQQAFQQECVYNNVAGCSRPAYGQIGWRGGVNGIPTLSTPPFSYQASLGVQRELDRSTVLNVDFSWIAEHNADVSPANANLAFDPVTGLNYPFNPVAGSTILPSTIATNSLASVVYRPLPELGVTGCHCMDGISNYLGIVTSINRRFSQRWTGQATWTYAELRDAIGNPFQGTLTPGATGSPFLAVGQEVQVAKGIDGDANDYTYAATDQRNRATFNGRYDMGKGFQISGLYFFGSGMAYADSVGGTPPTNDGSTSGGVIMTSTLRNTLLNNGTTLGQFCVSNITLNANFDGTANAAGPACKVGRNFIHAPQIDRVDMRLTKKFTFGEKVDTEFFAESFNLFNHGNYGAFSTTISATNINNLIGTTFAQRLISGKFGLGDPSSSTYLPYQPRFAQFGFRVDFK